MSGGADLFTVLSQTESGRMLAADTRPAVVVDRSGTRLLWANAAGAAFFGVDTVDKLAALRFASGSPFARRIAALDDTLTSGQDRIERLPLQRGFLPRPTVCKASRVAIDGVKAILLTIVDGTGSLAGDPATAFAALAATARPASALAAPAEEPLVGEITPKQGEVVEVAAEEVLTEPEAIMATKPEEAAEAVAAEAAPEPDDAAEKVAPEPEEAAGEAVAKPEEAVEAAAEGAAPEPEETIAEMAPEPEGTAGAVAEEVAPERQEAAEEVAAEPEDIVDATAEKEASEPEDAAPEPDEIAEEPAAEPEEAAEAVAEEIAPERQEAAEEVAAEPEDVVDATAEEEAPEPEDAAPEPDEIAEEPAAEPEEAARAVAEEIASEPGKPREEVSAEPEETVGTAAGGAAIEEAAPEPEAVPEPAAPLFSFPRHGRAVRFVFELDPLLAFTFVSSDLAETVGPGMSDIIGRTWSEVAGRLEFDPAGRVAEALGRRDTFTGLTVDWPVENESLRVPSDLAGMPVFGRERAFLGYRGFGVLKTGAAFEAPVPAEPIAASEPDAPLLPIPIAADEPETTADVGTDAGVTQSLVAVEETFEAAHEKPTPVDEPVAEEQEAAAGADLLPPADIDAPTEDIAGVVEEPAGTEAAVEIEAAYEEPTSIDEPAGDEPKTPAEPDEPVPADVAQDIATEKPTAEEPEAPADVVEDVTAGEPTADEPEATADVVKDVTAEEPTAEEPEAPADIVEGVTTGEPTAEEPEAPADVVEDVTAGEPTADEPEAPADVAQDVATEEPKAEEPEAPADVVEDIATGEPTAEEPEAPADVVEDVTAEKPTVEEPEAPADVVEDVAVGESVAERPEIPAEIEAESDILELTEAEESVAEETQAPAEAAAEPEPPAPPVAGEPESPAPHRTAFASLGDDKARGLSKPERDAFDKIAEALADAFGPRIVSESSDRSVIARPRAIETAPNTGPSIDIALLDKLPVALAILRDGNIIHANRAFLDLSGYPDVAAIEADGGFAQVFEGAALNRDAAIPTVRRRDGVEIPVSARLHSMPMASGIASLLVVQETAATTSRDRLATAEQRVEDMEAILDTATDGVLVLDQKGLVIGANKSAEALFGSERSQMIGMAFVDLLAPESHRSALDYLDGLSRNALSSVLNDGREVIGRVAGGGLVPLFMTVGRVSPTKFCAVLRDITQWKRAEEELTSAKKAAENASSQKSDFLAKMSHEIRTPLNAIIGFSEVMMEERFGPVGNERYKEYLRDIHVSGTHIMSLVNDLLDLSKIEAGKLELTFEAVGLNDVVRECAALMQPQANRERIIIRTSLSSSLPPVVADSRSLRQIVLNLLSNAVKFNTAGGQVIISTLYEDTGEVVLRVRDTGQGMSEGDIVKAMEPFRQLSTSRTGGGTGLGLPLTKALVEANRAAFQIDSTPGQGTMIQITFPSTRVLAE